MHCDDSFIIKKIKLSIETKMTGSADLKEQLEQILDNTHASNHIRSAPLNPGVPRVPRIECNKICGMDKSFVFICIIILLIIFLKYNDIISMFSNDNKREKKYLNELMNEKNYDDENDNDSDEYLEKNSKKKYHASEEDTTYDDSTLSQKKGSRNDIDYDQMSYMKKKNKDPLFQEFI